jgi:thymidylate synthase
MKNIENEYRGLLSQILNSGMDKEDRTGTGTRSIFGRTIRHQMSDGFPLLTGKKVSFNAARTELLWILNGRTEECLDHFINKATELRPKYARSKNTLYRKTMTDIMRKRSVK